MTIEQGNFLTHEQKRIKSQIIMEMFQVLQKNITENGHLLDEQSTTDIVFSCLIMFAREILVEMLLSTGNPVKYAYHIMIDFHQAVFREVVDGVTKSMTSSINEVH